MKASSLAVLLVSLTFYCLRGAARLLGLDFPLRKARLALNAGLWLRLPVST